MTCPDCNKETLRFSPKRRYLECACGYCAFAEDFVEELQAKKDSATNFDEDE